ncbi:hypothetical protein COT72_02715 [archaeon CG10_big_fil_rev_8_21_14_0_10_43_11]|nr:MAG: hypothetical protein COT72_02715 [archaeon CG10_big_fil_rev_8_21_14_0_10_43_11]
MALTKRVHLIGTGGTIAMVKNKKDAYVPAKSAQELIDNVPEVSALCNKKKRSIELSSETMSSIDSSNITTAHWKALGERVMSAYEKGVEGIVITHGTDTLQWTAQYLGLSFKNVSIPLVLTGSQIPIGQSGSDGIENLTNAIDVAGCLTPLNAVSVVFAHKILGYKNLLKTEIWDADAFDTPEYAYYGVIKNRVTQYTQHFKTPKKTMTYNSDWNFNTDLITPTPAMDPKRLEHALLGLDGAVIVGYGAGHVRVEQESLLEVLAAQSIPLIITSPAKGDFDLSRYEVGIKLKKQVIIASNLTPTYAQMKLQKLLGEKKTYQQIKNAFESNV